MDQRIHLYRRLQPTVGHAVSSIDIGTKNMAIVRIVREKETGQCLMTHGAHVNLRDPDGTETIDTIANNIVTLLMDPALEWLWYGVPGTNEWDDYLVTERQQDQRAGDVYVDNQHNYYYRQGDGGFLDADGAKYHLQGYMMISSDTGKQIKVHPYYKPPIMFAIYGMIRILASSVQTPVTFVRNAVFAQLQQAGVDVATMGNPRLVFVPRTGGQKLGMKDLRGNARKQGAALELAMEFMDEEGDDEASNWLETLERPKPLQDLNDAYLQARHFMNQKERELQAVVKKNAKVVEKAAKVQEKQTKAQEKQAKAQEKQALAQEKKRLATVKAAAKQGEKRKRPIVLSSSSDDPISDDDDEEEEESTVELAAIAKTIKSVAKKRPTKKQKVDKD